MLSHQFDYFPIKQTSAWPIDLVQNNTNSALQTSVAGLYMAVLHKNGKYLISLKKWDQQAGKNQ